MDNIAATTRLSTSSELIGKDGKPISCAVALTPLELNQVKIIGRHTPVMPTRLTPQTSAKPKTGLKKP